MKTGQQRPNPESLLKRVQVEEAKARRGTLKIYLGSAPGVGKTYTMLKDALDLRAKGVDILVGVAESHGREEIISMLNQLEILPRQIINYRGQSLLEFNLDAAIKRNPGICLIDEMAHTNAPGLRHTKRWQDINEILNHGIDVYTTLNVQHIESLNDIASRIIQTQIKETVPDSVLENAHTIELVDLPPDDLLKRLREGKIYFSEQAEIAKDYFFRKGNLAALRELALRVTADHVGVDVFLYRENKGIKDIWPTKEKILVCIGHSEEAIRLIRRARRMATHLRAEWIAVYVDTSRLGYNEKQKNKAIQHLLFAERLGAETRILNGSNPAKEILNLAREKNITQIVIGKNTSSRWRDLVFSSLADKIVRSSREINVLIVTLDSPRVSKKSPLSYNFEKKPKTPLKIYGFSLVVIASVTLLSFFLSSYLATNNLIMIYLLGISMIALFGHPGPSIFACVMSVLLYDFFFIPPIFSFAISDIQYFLTMLIMLVVAMIISHLTIETHYKTTIAKKAEEHATALYTLSRHLTHARDITKVLEVAVSYLAKLFDSNVMILLPEESRLVERAASRTSKYLDDKEKSIAEWVYTFGQQAGLNTDTLSFSKSLYIPLLTSQKSIGVLSVSPRKADDLFTPQQLYLLGECANQIAVQLEICQSTST